MSGVFGILDSKRQMRVEPLLTRMGARMSHREWYIVETFWDEDAGVGLGRIGIGIFNRERQPLFSEDQNLVVFLTGEFYNAAELRGMLKAKGHHFQDESDLELVLRLYQDKGKQFVRDLNGAFVLVVWNRSSQEVIIANDRFGLYPLFYAHHNGRFIFAPEMKGILCDHTFPRRLDLTALAQYMRFQHLLGERTFFEGIELLPNASLLVYNLSTDTFRCEKYWDFADIPYRPEVSFDEAVEETGRLLRRAVQRLSGDAYRPGVYLSGGLDSRTILGLIERRPVVSLTYGVRNCRDVYYARRIARAVGSQHYWCDLPDGNWVREWVDFHLELTEGFHTWIHMHGISTLPLARQLMDVNLTGWDGGSVMGHPGSIEPLLVSAVDDLAFIARIFYVLTHTYTWPSITEGEENMLYCEPLRRKIQGLAFDSLRDEVSRYLHYRPDVRSEFFSIRNHCGRMTQSLVVFTRSHIEVRFPYFDYDLFEFLYSLPASLRADRRLFRAVIQRETPRLAYIPYAEDEFLPTAHSWIRNLHGLGVRLKRRFNRHIGAIFPERKTLYADYEDYLRHELREWASGILFDPHTLERGIFAPEFVESIFKRHQSGMEQWTIGKIAPIMTYEMMLRRFYDS